MELPKFGMPQNPDPYEIPAPGSDKKKLLLMFGGIIALIILLILVIFSGGGNEGQADMRTSLQSSSDAIGILDTYNENIANTGLKNELALSLIILRGQQQSLNELYKKTYPKAKKFSSSPKPDEKSVATLDQAHRNNVLDTEIIPILQAKVKTAHSNITKAKANFSQASSRKVITNAQEDLAQISEILNKSY